MKAIVVAMDKNRLIGKDGKLPWRLPNDLKHFRLLTLDRTVIMGRKTFESIGKPLERRVNIVITSKPDELGIKYPGIYAIDCLMRALSLCKKDDLVYIIGGAQVYKEALSLVDKLYVTLILNTFTGDTYFPEIDRKIWQLIKVEPVGADIKNPYHHCFIEYVKK